MPHQNQREQLALFVERAFRIDQFGNGLVGFVDIVQQTKLLGGFAKAFVFMFGSRDMVEARYARDMDQEQSPRVQLKIPRRTLE